MTRVRSLFTYVVEDTPAWHREALNLALSIRTSAENHATDPVLANFVGSVDEAIKSDLERLDVDVRVVPRFDPRSAPCNKLNAIRLDPSAYDADVVILLDADTIVVSDPSSLAVDLSNPSACPEFNSQLTIPEWAKLFEAAGRKLPTTRMLMTSSGEETIPYWSSGLVVIPRETFEPFVHAWREDAVFVMDWLETNRPDRIWFSDQIALALTGNRFSISTLPREVHRLTTTRVKIKSSDPQKPIVIHYGPGITDAGFLERSESQRDLNHGIHAFNQVLAEYTGMEYSTLPRQPPLDRLARSLSKAPVFRSGLVRSVRSSRVSAPLRRLWKRAQRRRRAD